MPVILPDEEAVDEWLYPRQSSERLRALLPPVRQGYLARTAVSSRVNSVANDDPECLVEAEHGAQGALL
jgi:putative SOS response-associated peptidase YedK